LKRWGWSTCCGTNGQPANHQYSINGKNGRNSQFHNNITIGGGYGGSSVFSYQLGGQAIRPDMMQIIMLIKQEQVQ